MIKNFLKLADRLDSGGDHEEADLIDDVISDIGSGFFENISIPHEDMLDYLACLRMVQLYHQHAHWVSKGLPYYGDHLLFERLYNNTISEVDNFAERAVGLSGDEAVCPISVIKLVYKKMAKVLDGFDTTAHPDEIVEYALGAEKYLLISTKGLYDNLKSDGKMTMGLDDLLMEIYSAHETNVYLLQQRIKKADRVK